MTELTAKFAPEIKASKSGDFIKARTAHRALTLAAAEVVGIDPEAVLPDASSLTVKVWDDVYIQVSVRFVSVIEEA